MAIDVRQLHIGAHVLVDGRRERVRGLDEDNGLIVRFPAEYVSADDVEPIAITPELLTEMGFEDFTKLPYGEWEKWWDKKKYMCFSSIKDNLWRVRYMDGMMDLGNCVCRYLHQAEAFLALHNVELIAD